MFERILESSQDLPPELREIIEQMKGAMAGGAAIGIALIFSLLFSLFFYSIFGLLGGLIGAMMFRKNAPPPPPPGFGPPTGFGPPGGFDPSTVRAATAAARQLNPPGERDARARFTRLHAFARITSARTDQRPAPPNSLQRLDASGR